MRTLEILETTEIRTKYQNMFDHILVDEFQDTDINQYKILKILAENTEFMCCWRSDQSIMLLGANYQNSQMFIQGTTRKNCIKSQLSINQFDFKSGEQFDTS